MEEEKKSSLNVFPLKVDLVINEMLLCIFLLKKLGNCIYLFDLNSSKSLFKNCVRESLIFNTRVRFANKFSNLSVFISLCLIDSLSYYE